MIGLKRLAASVLFALIAGCGDDESEGADLVTVDSVADVGFNSAAGMDQPPSSAEGATVQLLDVQGSVAGGQVTVYDRGGQTEVEVRLTGATPSTDHPGHLHGGSCSAIGSVLEPLDTVSTDSTGVGSMTTNVPMTRAEVAASQSVVVYFTSSGTPLVCAELPVPAGIENSTTL